jgi:hypothetical protein
MKTIVSDSNKKKKVLKFVLILILLVISIKPLQFTYHLMRAGYYYYFDKPKAETQIVAAINKRPSVYHSFRTFNHSQADRLLMKSIIDNESLKPLNSAHLTPGQLNRIKKTYNNNIYLAYLFPKYWPQVRHIQDLEPLSLQLLADPSYNPLTEKAFSKHLSHFSIHFMVNLSQYCNWQGNHRMGQFWEQHAVARGWTKPTQKINQQPLRYNQSVRELVRLLATMYNIKYTEKQIIKGNRIKNPGIENPLELTGNWEFKEMANSKHFGNGSFVMGPDKSANNTYFRLMGFYTNRNVLKAKSKKRQLASGGAWYREKIDISPGLYLFTFDYATFYGVESATFHLGKFIKQPKLPHTRRSWQKVFFFLNNSKGQFKSLRPLIRMLGTGTFLVDNIALLKIESKQFRLKYPHLFLSIRMGAVR